MDTDIARWKELAHRAIDDAFGSISNKRFYPGSQLSEEELKEFNTLDAKLGHPSEKLKQYLNNIIRK